MSKHTPGPWTIRELTGEDHRGMGWIAGPDGQDVTCYGAQERWMEVNRANAKLICAAPELLEKLDQLTLVVGLTAFKHEEQRAVLQQALDEARTAIAKATT